MFSRLTAIALYSFRSAFGSYTLRRWLWLRVAVALILIAAIIIGGSGFAPAASARVMREELQTGDVLYKSLRTLTDNRGYSWQAIAFRQIPEGSAMPQPDPMYLRLVGFPGAVSIDRSKPLIVAAPAGQQFTLLDRSDLIFKHDLPPQPNVGQYPLTDVLAEVRSPLPLRLTLPTLDADAVELRLPRVIVEEWLDVDQRADSR